MRVKSGCGGVTAAGGAWLASEGPDGWLEVLLGTALEGSPVEGDDEVHAATDSATPSAAPRGNDRFRISSSGCGVFWSGLNRRLQRPILPAGASACPAALCCGAFFGDR